MIHTRRRFNVSAVSVDDAIAALTTTDYWTCCSGYRITHEGRTLLVLNDAFDENTAQEFAVLLVLATEGESHRVIQVESLTMSWVEPERRGALLREALDAPPYGAPFTIVAQDPERHGRCILCA